VDPDTINIPAFCRKPKEPVDGENYTQPLIVKTDARMKSFHEMRRSIQRVHILTGPKERL
jgi:hypothetical protein